MDKYRMLNDMHKPSSTHAEVSTSSSERDDEETEKSRFSEKEIGDPTRRHKVPVPDNLHKDYTKTIEPEQRWTLVHEGPLTSETEQSDESELSDMPSAAFKGYKPEWDYRDNTHLNESPPSALIPPESPPTQPLTPQEEKAITGSSQAWGPIQAPINIEWLPHIQHMYRGCSDFKLVAQYPELHTTISNLEFTVYKTKDFQFVTIFWNNTNDGSLALCIVQNCRRLIDGELHELSETIIRGGNKTLGHASGEKSYYYLKDYFYWPSIRKDTMDYCKQCDTCQRASLSTQAPQWLARPLPILQQPFTHIAMDFLFLPPKVRKEHGQEIIHQQVWTIVNRFSKYVKILPLTKNTTADNLISKLFYYVYPDWGMPQDIVSDRNAKFTSKAWKDFYETFQIHQSMNTAYHPRTDGQSEVANKAIIQQIKKMVHEGDSNRLGQLPHIQSRLNRIRSSSRNGTPYDITIGHNPRLIGDMSVKIPTQEETPTQRISRINQTQEIVRKRLQEAKLSQAIQSNKRCRPAPEFSVGHQVLLSTKNLPLATSYRKIAPEWLGPLTITSAYQQTGNYTLRLPDDLTGIDPTLHVEVIKAYIPNDNKRFPSRKNTKPGPLPEFEHEDR